MAISVFPCPDCEKDVSKRAAACPHCGCPLKAAPVVKPAEIIVKQKKEMGCGGLLVIGFLAMFIYGTFSSIGDDDSSTSKTPPVPKTAEQIRADKVHSAFSGWNGAHRELEKLVKNNLNDPDSYEHIETRYNDNVDHIYVVMKYRAKNGFGGYVVETIAAKASVSGMVTEIVSTP